MGGPARPLSACPNARMSASSGHGGNPSLPTFCRHTICAGCHPPPTLPYHNVELDRDQRGGWALEAGGMRGIRLHSPMSLKTRTPIVLVGPEWRPVRARRWPQGTAAEAPLLVNREERRDGGAAEHPDGQWPPRAGQRAGIGDVDGAGLLMARRDRLRTASVPARGGCNRRRAKGPTAVAPSLYPDAFGWAV